MQKQALYIFTMTGMIQCTANLITDEAGSNEPAFILLTKYNIFIVFVKMYRGLLIMPSSERKGDL